MIPGSLKIDFGQRLQLLPDRAIYWASRKTLIVADVHLGKGAAFRQAGVPVPSGGSAKDLRRLDALLAATCSTRLVILGDLIHARSSHQQELRDAIATWRTGIADCEMLLVRGNHDRKAGRLPVDWNVQEVEEPFEDADLILSHIPRYDQPKPVLAGHLHPARALRDFDRSTVRVPCFFESRGCLVLPAFGTFTGGHVIKIDENDRCHLAPGRKVIRCF